MVQQQLALFRRSELLRLLGHGVPASTTPQQWEVLNNVRSHVKSMINGSTSGSTSLRALALRTASADALQQITEVAHEGRVRRGWGLCVFQHAALQLGLSPASVPITPLPEKGCPYCRTYSRRNPLNDSSYAFCRQRSAAAREGDDSTTGKEEEREGAQPCLVLLRRNAHENVSVITNVTSGPCIAVKLAPLAARPSACTCDLAQPVWGQCSCRGVQKAELIR